MKIYLGADHRGFELKNKVFAYLQKRGYDVEDVGNKELDPHDDSIQFAQAAALKLIDKEHDTDRAILICGSGQNMCMAANRFRGVRAVAAATADDAHWGRRDNNANALCLSGRNFTNDDDQFWQDIIDTFLNTEFAGFERYVRRNKLLDELS